ncbi:ACP S-malonyltransferase [Wukongibacter sp. M2B1]|uniref:ACP S-malonyltransferase n=1 Tax=Wukongibacter sp. M2B1 TaxID=3088895 RepID=UPI003D7A6B0A
MKKIALLFPGQGSQYIGMGKSLYEEYDIAKETFEEANSVLGYDLKNICFKGSLSELNEAENMLTAILTTSVAAYRVFMQEIGVEPRFMAGHSLGEYSALTCSGAIEFKDALKIVRLRSILAKEAALKENGTMTIVENVNKKIVEEACLGASSYNELVNISCYNSENQYAISGTQNAVMKAEDLLLEEDANITPLIMGIPFHSPLMENARVQLERELNNYKLKPFKYPVISNVTALPYKSEDEIVDKLSLQLVKPVQWRNTLNYLEQEGIDFAIEIGPQSILKNLVRDEELYFDIYSFNQKSDHQVLLQLLNADKPLKEITVITKCLAMAVATRNRNWNNSEYEEGVLKPCRKIKEIQERLDEQNKAPEIQDMKMALDMLYTIFNTKKVPKEEQIRRFNRILKETRTKNIFDDFLEGRYSQSEKIG